MDFLTIPKTNLESIINLLSQAHNGLVAMSRSIDGNTEIKRFYCKDGMSVWLFTTNEQVLVSVF